MEMNDIKASLQAAYDAAVVALKAASDAVDGVKASGDTGLAAAYQKGWDDRAAFIPDGTSTDVKIYSQSEADQLIAGAKADVTNALQPQIDKAMADLSLAQTQINDLTFQVADLTAKLAAVSSDGQALADAQAAIVVLQGQVDGLTADNAAFKADAQAKVNEAFQAKMTEVMASMDELQVSEQANADHVIAIKAKLAEAVPPVLASPVDPVPVPVDPAPVDPPVDAQV